MWRACGAALAIWLLAAGAAAQVPRDPLANPQSGAAAGGGAAAQQPAPFVTKQNDVEIPFNVRPGTNAENQPSSVRIYVSWDRGQNWHFYDERKAEDGRFRFRAKQDGEFWFATQTVDRSGRPDSAEPRRPQLRLVIDTQRPKLLVQAHVTGAGAVNLSWSAADATLIASSLRLEYQDAGGSGGPWQAIEASSPTTNATTITGQATFVPAVSSRTINLRAEIADSAGNLAYYSQRIALTPPKPKDAGNSLAFDPSATRWPEAKSPGQDVNSQIAADTPRPGGGDDEKVRIPAVVNNPFAGPGRLASNSPSPESLSTENLPLPGGEPPSVEPLPTQPGPNFPEPPLPPMVEIMPTPQPAEPIDPASAERPRLTNSRRFSLEYDIQSVGPEGVQAVELWGTNDGGRTWTKWGTDPDKASPFDVEVSREATYGFRIVVAGKNGLATSTPQSGDAADIWVNVDLTRPTAKLTGAVYGQGAAAGKLDIRWQADDANLGGRPVTLAIGDRPDGRFMPIATGLPNTGEYFWEYDPRSPRQIYLRLEVRDDAGNVAIDQLTEPIKVEGLEPKGQIRGFKPAGENRGSFRSPLIR
jgi:hypothetical protein